jgi:protein ImuA
MPNDFAHRATSIADLRKLISATSSDSGPRACIPFGIDHVDGALPEGGLIRGALHEFADNGARSSYAVNAALFVSGILARLDGPVLWCLHSRDLFTPALARVGLDPSRIIFCETWKDGDVLPAMEDGLRIPGLAGVVGELKRLPLTASRRLQLAAEASGVTAFVIARSQDIKAEANAAYSRWRISSLPSQASDDDVLGRPLWRVELVRCRGAAPQCWTLEACVAKGRCALPANVPDRSFAADERWQARA